MKYTPSLVAAGIVLATTAFSFAAECAPKLNLSEARTVSVARATDASDSSRVYCYTGVTTESDANGVRSNVLYRGWVCRTASSEAN